MAGALFSRVKTWIAETLTVVDLNAEIQNILDKFGPQWMDDYSATVAQMQSTVDPGEVGTESQATSTAGELERIRFLIKEITGKDQWYETPAVSLESADTLLSQGDRIPSNRIVSGLVRNATTDQQPVYLVPNGAAASFDLEAAGTDFVYYVAGVAYTLTADVSKTGMSLAPSSNNTCLVDDSTLAGADATRIQGEHGTSITIGTVGSEISSLVGTFQVFKTSTEYLYAFIESATSLTKIRRGYFFDSAKAPLQRVAISDTDTLTLMKVAYAFIKTDGTIATTGNLPVVSDTTPSGPSNGDYWFDTTVDLWKTYNGSSYEDSTSTYLGLVATDSANTVAARSEDFFALYSSLNGISTERKDNAVLRALSPGQVLSVRGTQVDFSTFRPEWDMASHLDDGDDYNGSEQASTTYYAYIDERSGLHLSDVEPYDYRSTHHLGYYHPHHSGWRCVAYIDNDGSSHLDASTLYNIEKDLRVFSETFTSSGTFNNRDNVSFLSAKVCGGGGGGSGADVATYNRTGAGGSGAVYVHDGPFKVAPSESITITIGAGGAGGATANPGSDGGTSSFGSYLSALGGRGGISTGNQTANTPGGSGGDGGAGGVWSSTASSFVCNPQPGGNTNYAQGGAAGGGATTDGGGGGAGVGAGGKGSDPSTSNAAAGAQPGGGGGGGGNGTAAEQAGAAGGAGQIIVYYKKRGL